MGPARRLVAPVAEQALRVAHDRLDTHVPHNARIFIANAVLADQVSRSRCTCLDPFLFRRDAARTLTTGRMVNLRMANRQNGLANPWHLSH